MERLSQLMTTFRPAMESTSSSFCSCSPHRGGAHHGAMGLAEMGLTLPCGFFLTARSTICSMTHPYTKRHHPDRPCAGVTPWGVRDRDQELDILPTLAPRHRRGFPLLGDSCCAVPGSASSGGLIATAPPQAKTACPAAKILRAPFTSAFAP